MAGPAVPLLHAAGQHVHELQRRLQHPAHLRLQVSDQLWMATLIRPLLAIAKSDFGHDLVHFRMHFYFLQ